MRRDAEAGLGELAEVGLTHDGVVQKIFAWAFHDDGAHSST